MRRERPILRGLLYALLAYCGLGFVGMPRASGADAGVINMVREVGLFLGAATALAGLAASARQGD